MKIFILIVLFIVLFMFFFFLLSAVGILWLPYMQIISDPSWFVSYTVGIGWWLAGIVVWKIEQDWQ